MAPEMNHFARLGINAGASENEIKKAYRTLAKKWHPDKNKDIRAKEMFQEIAASYEFLSSTDRREMHERELSKAAAETTHPTKHSSMRTGKQTTASAPSPDKAKQTSSPSWSQSFTKYYQDQQKKQSNYRNTKTFIFTSADFSFIFGNKEDKMPSTSVAGEGDNPAEHLREAKVEKLMKARGRPNKPPQQRHIAAETGDSTGLDTAYLFSPWQQQPVEENFQDKLSCPWCGAPFTPGKLFQHEEKCGKFGLSADEDEDSDSDDGCLTQSRQPGHSNMPVWQYEHQQLIRQIQRDKENYRSRSFRLGRKTTD